MQLEVEGDGKEHALFTPAHRASIYSGFSVTTIVEGDGAEHALFFTSEYPTLIYSPFCTPLTWVYLVSFCRVVFKYAQSQTPHFQGPHLPTHHCRAWQNL